MEKLRPWQVEPANRLLEILRAGGNAVDLSDTGVGKTYVACAVAAALGENTLAIVPKISISSWGAVGEQFGLSLPVIGYEALRVGQTNFGRWEHQRQKAEEHFVCMNCQCVVDFDDYRLCHCHPAGLHCIKTKRKPHRYGKFIWNADIKFLIFDEVHRCSALDSLNADMLIAARRQRIRVLGLSATAACTPLQMRALGYVIALHNDKTDIIGCQTGTARTCEIFPSFRHWVSGYGVRLDPVHHYLKWEVSAERQVEVMKQIHDQIIPSRGVRVRTSDIPDFPERVITTELYDLEKDYEIENIYREMASALDALSQRAGEDVDSESPLTQILRLRMRAELLAVPIFVELAEDALAKRNSVAIFVNFTATLAELRLRLKTDCVVDGSVDGVKQRDASIRRFQSNDERLILLNSAAGGQSINLQDLHGVPRVCLVSPSFSAVEFVQVCGRTHRAGGRSPAVYKIILVAGTVEEKIKRAIDKKLDNLSALVDGDLNPNER